MKRFLLGVLIGSVYTRITRGEYDDTINKLNSTLNEHLDERAPDPELEFAFTQGPTALIALLLHRWRARHQQ